MELIMGAPIDDRSPVIGNNAPRRSVSLTPPEPELDVLVVVLVLFAVLVAFSGLDWHATIQIAVTVANKARQTIEKNLLVMVAINYDHICKVAVIV
jgi:hypothetical protein